jgi:hypothetical protein
MVSSGYTKNEKCISNMHTPVIFSQQRNTNQKAMPPVRKMFCQMGLRDSGDYHNSNFRIATGFNMCMS